MLIPKTSLGIASTLVRPTLAKFVQAPRTFALRSFHTSLVTYDQPALKGPPKLPALPGKKSQHALDYDANDPNSDRHVIRNVTKYMWPKNNWNFKARVIIALGLLVGGKLLNIQVPLYFKEIVDAMNIDWSHAGPMGTSIVVLILSYGIARFGATLFQELRNAIFATVGQRAVHDISYNSFKHLLSLDHNFHLNNPTGQLTRAIDRGCKGLSYVVSALVFHMAPLVLEVGLVGGILIYNYGASFAVVTLSTMGAYALFTIRTTAWRSQFRRQANKADNVSNGIATESLTNFESVKLFGNEQYQLAKFDKSLTTYEKQSVKIATSLAFLNSGQNFIFSSALTIMMYLTCEGVSGGGMTVGDLILVNQLVFQLSVPLNFLGSVYRDMKQALLDMQALFQLQKYEVLIKNKPDAKTLLVTRGEVKFENVSFSYREGLPIMRNLTFTIPAGQRVAFVGPSGSGKSTILRLLFRFYEPEAGRITIDGQDITDVTLESLRANIGVVPQDTPLFNDTIANNIRFGRLDASKKDLIDAIEGAELTKLIERLPEGLQTKVGERGLMISGGERQRIAVARVLLKNAPITFFDEATSALDTETEQSLLHNVNRNLHGTGIFIAHRLRTVADTDHIIVLRNGEVAEEGKHNDLLADPKSLYSALWNAQELRDVEERIEEEIDDKP